MSVESTQRIENEAGRWLARRDCGQWSAANEHEFQTWMNQSIAHSVAYWRLQDAWEAALRLKALGAGVSSDDPPAAGQWNVSPFFSPSGHRQDQQTVEPKQRTFRLRVRALAASVAIAAAIAVVMSVVSHSWSSADTFQTPVGGVASLPISDGSKVTLNTDSAIKIAIDRTQRRIDLTHGEAFFEVAKDPARPFIVNAGDRRVIAIGTSFSVRTGIGTAGDDVEVVVTEGAVRIESAQGGNVRKVSAEPLKAGSIARTRGAQLDIQHKDTHEAEEQLSWRTGVLVFRDATLADAAAQFNRYNKKKIVIEDPAVAALSVAGNFRSTGVDSFVEIIAKGYPVRVEHRRGDFVISAER